MVKRGRRGARHEDGLPDLDLEIDHGHDHDRDKDREQLRRLHDLLDREGEREQEPDVERVRERELPREIEKSLTPALDDEIEFHQDLREVTPRVIWSYLLIGANVAIFGLLVLVYHVSFMMPTATDLLPWGANFAPLTTTGDWWRLFTCMFLHFGALHIGFNMWILKEVGPLVERLVGNTGFLIVYLGSGLVASLASTWWNPEAVSAGASGAIFGVIGVLLGVLILGHGIVPKAALSRLRKAVTTFVFFNVYIGLKTPGIDMAAHLGGLGVGVLCGMVMTRVEMLDSSEGREGRNLTAAAVCGLSILWMLVLIPDGGSQATRMLLQFDEIRTRTDSVYDVAVDEMERLVTSDDECADTVDGLVVELRGIQRQLAALEDVESALADDVLLAARYLLLRIESWEALIDGLRTNEVAEFDLWKQKERETERLEREFQ